MTRRMLLTAAAVAATSLCASHAQEMSLVENGRSRAPIVVAADAPSETLRAARYLAEYMEKIGGARPEVLEGAPDPAPDSAIWIGAHPHLTALFPKTEFDFAHPEEILIVCDGRNLAILGRDRMLAGEQVEFGTANAVYEFLQRYLGVRWLWPGELGEDILPRETITVDAGVYRFHPQFLWRKAFPRMRDGEGLAWNRFHRNHLDSLNMQAGHAFGDWWKAYHATHPEYFALQPDGTHSRYPEGNEKLCEANPAVWQQWLDNAAADLDQDPTKRVFNAAPNDASNAGICVCDKCRAWDNLDAPGFRLMWRGLSQEYVAMADRYITFWNQLARMLKGAYPDRDDLYVSGMAYGPAKPPPVAARPADNVIIGYVGSFPVAGDRVRDHEKATWRAWARSADTMVFRPNVFWYSGGWHGIPTPVVRNTLEDFRFLGENNCVGITLDHPPQHFAPMAPMYYAMAQLSWNPLQDGEAMMADFYRRGFGPAAAHVEAYYQLMEEAHAELVNRPEWSPSMGRVRWVAQTLPECYTPERMAAATSLLDKAAALTADGRPIYHHRLAFVRASLDYTLQHFEILETMRRVRESSGGDRAAVERAVALCEQRDELFKNSPPYAFTAHHFHVTWNRARSMQDYLGPPADRFLVAAGLKEGAPVKDSVPEGPPVDKTAYRHRSAEEAGWRLVFEDDFQRDTLGDDWMVLDGVWRVEDGGLVSSGGMLVSARTFPGNQRLEFEGVTYVKPFPFFGPDTEASVTYSDISPFIQTGADGWQSGYFLQFGGHNNSLTRLLRMGNELDRNTEVLIDPGKVHRIVAENDDGQVRLVVDGKLAVAWNDAHPLSGEGHDRIGFYMWTGAKIRNLKVYTK